MAGERLGVGAKGGSLSGPSTLGNRKSKLVTGIRSCVVPPQLELCTMRSSMFPASMYPIHSPGLARVVSYTHSPLRNCTLRVFLLSRRLKRKGRKGEPLDLQQPSMRADYVLKMLGVDLADQQNGSHTHDHKAYTNFWRRMFDAKTEQALTNAFLIFRKWVELLIRQVEARRLVVSGADLEGLDRASTELLRLKGVERVVWDEEMATMLMAKCGVAKPNTGGRRPASEKKPAGPVWGSVTLNYGRLCLNPTCKTRSSKGCTCAEFCTRGDDSGVLMCETCWKKPESHERAAKAYWDGVPGRRNRTKFEWQRR